MNSWPTRREVESVRARYKKGMRIELIHMDDIQAPLSGTKGTILAVDDAGQLVVRWDTGSSLSALPGVDEFRIISDDSREGGNSSCG